jgi:hypothetical protein
MSELVISLARAMWPQPTGDWIRGQEKGKDIRDIFEGHATEGGHSSRCWGRLLGVVLIGDYIEMDGFRRDFSVPEQNLRV